MKPIVLLDCDGVLADFEGAVLSRMGGSYTREHVTDWTMSAIPAHVVDGAFFEMLEPGACSKIPLYAGAVEGIAALQDMATVRIVTAPFRHKGCCAPQWHAEREEWLSRHFGIPHKHVVHTHHKDLVRGDFFVDDRPEYVAAWQAAHPHGRAFLWATSHNRSESNRISNWDEVIAEVQQWKP